MCVFIIKALYLHLHNAVAVGAGKISLKVCVLFVPSSLSPQDSDGDKSEDNLVVDVSNEVSPQLLFLIFSDSKCLDSEGITQQMSFHQFCEEFQFRFLFSDITWGFSF